VGLDASGHDESNGRAYAVVVCQDRATPPGTYFPSCLYCPRIAAVQMGLQATALLSPMMASSSSWLSGSVLVAAGLFQFSHLKQACLSQCRSPVTYFMTEWRNGHVGALLMGLNHGVHCVGCCWILMALLFVAGVMNILWMAIIMAFVLIEKLAVRGVLFGRIAGVGLIVWGIIVLI
jgi:predicted metal-binding membrane protein